MNSSRPHLIAAGPIAGRTVVAAVALALSLPAPNATANDNAADTTNADQLWPSGTSGYNLTGAGVTVGIWEANDADGWAIRDTHEQFNYGTNQSRISFGDPAPSSFSGHATHVASTLGGAHIPGKEQYWGMAPGVSIVSFSSAADDTEIRNEAAGYGIDITNHSYGTNTGGWSQESWDVPDGQGGFNSLTYETWQFGPDWYFDLYDETPASGRYSNSAYDLDRAIEANPGILSFWSAGNSRSNDYDDVQNDGKFVARFSPAYQSNVGVVGTELSDNWFLVDSADYELPGWDGSEYSGGYDSLSYSRTAKNIVTVGSTLDHTVDPHNGTIVTLNSFSNFGPTDDGRIGVDLVANGNAVSGADSDSDTDYATRSGTSFSSPNAAGTAALVLEYWRGQNGNLTPDAMTQKGLLLHTATDVVANGQVGPDYRTGYGLMNGLAAVQHLDEAYNTPFPQREDHVIEGTLHQGETIEIDLLGLGTNFKASLSWLDPADPDNVQSGLDSRTPLLINDLDLWLTDSFDNIYYPWTLDPENPAAPATRDKLNEVDNFVQVYLSSITLDAPFTLHVGHDTSLQNGFQDFGLFISGATIMIPQPAGLALIALGLPLISRRSRPG